MRGTIYFIGFDSASLEKVVISKYNGYNQKVDSTIYLLSNSPTRLTFLDTPHKHVIWPYHEDIYPGDWEVRVPNAGNTYRISGFSSTSGSVEQSFLGNDEECFDVVTGYYLNSVYTSTGVDERLLSNVQTQPVVLRR